MKRLIMLATMTVVIASGYLGVRMDTSVPVWFSVSEAEASPYRRSVRRTARRTARRTSYRHNAYSTPVYGSTVVVGVPVATVAVGTIITTLPPSCGTMFVNGMNYYNCAGSYYVASGNQWVVVAAP